MRFLLRLLPYWRWIVGVIGIVSVIGAVSYVRHLWIEAEIAQRSYEQAIEQLEAVTGKLEAERQRHEQTRKRLDEAAREAAESDDAHDMAADSTRKLLDRLYGD